MKSQSNTRARHSHALSLYAGECTNRVAEHYPFPHTDILAAPSERLHLACFAIVHGHTSDDDLEGIVTEKTWSRAIPKELVGLLQSRRYIFKKLELPGFLPHTYRALKKVMTDPAVETFFRKASSISEADVLKMFALPPALRIQTAYSYLRDPKEAFFFKKVVEVLVESLGADEIVLAKELARSPNEKAFWKVLWSALEKAAPEYPKLPVNLPEGWRQLRNAHELHEAGEKFENCLSSYWSAQNLQEAIIVRETEPKAVASIASKYDGTLFIEDLTGPRNKSFEKKQESQLIEELMSVGIQKEEKGTIGFLERLKDEISAVSRSEPKAISRRTSRISDAVEFLRNSNF